MKTLSRSTIALIALKEFFDRFRSGWVIACVVVWLGAIGLTSFFGLIQIGRIGVQGYERTVISLLNFVQFLVPLLGLLVGHDLIVSEREERTLALMAASGVSRWRIVLGKLAGGLLTMAFPLILGFAMAGTVIGVATRDSAFMPFLVTAISGLGLGLVFVAIGLFLSTLSRTRVQSLVLALLTWCFAVFAFDLVAMGILVSTKMPAAAREIEVLCDTTHVNELADIHSAFDGVASDGEQQAREKRGSSWSWVLVNPVNLFRAMNLPSQLNITVPAVAGVLTCIGWITACAAAAAWRFRRVNL